MSELTHWKKLTNPNYLGSYALQPGEEPILTIKKVGLEMVVGADGKKEECTVAHFAEDAKPMILNATNCKTIEKIYGTGYIEHWPGKQIQVYSAKIRAFGEEMEALRIRPKAPVKQKPVLDRSYKGWENALSAIKNGEASIEYLQQKYTIPSDCLKLMQEAQNA